MENKTAAKLGNKIKRLEKTVKLLVETLDKYTEPEKSYVQAWHVIDEWKELKERLHLNQKY